MGYPVNIEGMQGKNVEVQVSAWTAPRLLVDGQPAAKGQKRGELLLQLNDGRQVTAVWKPQLLGLDPPQLVVDGQATPYIEPLKWYQWVWSALPIVLIFAGGALGALIGIVAFYINASVFRGRWNSALKYVLTALISLAAALIYLVIALSITFLLPR